MIEKIRWRFVAIAMGSLFVVMLISIGGENAFNFKTVNDYSDTVLSSLAQNGGIFVAFTGGPNGDKPLRTDEMTVETQYETRYFTVSYNKAANVVVVDTTHIASVDAETACQYANEALSGNKNKGYSGTYRYLVHEVDDNTVMVLFVDNYRQLAIAQEFLHISVLIALAVFIGVFILVMLLSKKTVQPIAESYEKQKRFITDASHELKTPLTIISANNEIIEMDYGENESTRSIAKQVSRMADMTKNLTMLAKIDESDVLKEKTRFVLSDTVADVTQPYLSLAEAKGMTLTSNVEDKIDFVGDERLIRQMLSLILDNAVKYGKNNIVISLKRNKKDINLQIKNDTESVEQGNLDKYFDRFFRSDETRASGVEGSGIGLSIVKEIVGLHKGRITATGRGNEFIIDISFI